MSARADSIRIIDADPGLGQLVPAADREQARRETLTGVRRLSPGSWDVVGAEEPDAHHRGFLIVDGLITREVDVLRRRCVELLGAGDGVRPWCWGDGGSHVEG